MASGPPRPASRPRRRRCRRPPEPAADRGSVRDRRARGRRPRSARRPLGRVAARSLPAVGRDQRQHEVRSPDSVRDGTSGVGEPIGARRTSGGEVGLPSPRAPHRSHRRHRLRQVDGVGPPRRARARVSSTPTPSPGSSSSPAPRCSTAMVERFGPAIVAADGTLDRQAVADIVFTDAGGAQGPRARSSTRRSASRSPRRLEAEAGHRPRRGPRRARCSSSRAGTTWPRSWSSTSTPRSPSQRLVEQRGMREADARARMAQPGAPRGAAGQGRPRDRQLGHASRTSRAQVDELWARLLALGRRPLGDRRLAARTPEDRDRSAARRPPTPCRCSR